MTIVRSRELETEFLSAAGGNYFVRELPQEGAPWRQFLVKHIDATLTVAGVQNIGWGHVRDGNWKISDSVNIDVSLSSHIAANQKYTTLFELLREFENQDEDEPSWIDEVTYRSSCSVLSLLSYNLITPPTVFSHGGDAVVFVWAFDNYSFYVTVSEDTVSLSLRPAGGRAHVIDSSLLSETGAHWLLRFLKVQGDSSSTNRW